MDRPSQKPAPEPFRTPTVVSAPRHGRPRRRPLRAWCAGLPLLAAGLVGGLPPAPVAAQVDTVRIEDLSRRLGRDVPEEDSIYGSAALRDFVGRAAEANRVLPDLLESYRARVESEISIVQAEGDGREVVLQLEQVASDLLWRRDLPPVQQVVGYRSRTIGLIPSVLSMFDVPWVVPTLYGDRIDLVHWNAPSSDDEGRVRRRRAVHPLGADREAIYRFAGGDTVLVLHVSGRTLPLVRIEVTPVRTPDLPTLLFEGHMDIDATRHQIVRMRGRMFVADRNPSLGERLLGAAFTGATYVEFESAEYDQRFWLPRYQRVEVQAISRLSEGRVVLRLVSRFGFPELDDPGPLAELHPNPPPGGLLIVGEAMAASDFQGWTAGLGELTREVDAEDFIDLEPERQRAEEQPTLGLGARHLSHLVRFNEAEGLFTGVGVVFRPGPVWPAGRVRVHGGWAWAEGTARGGAEVTHAPPSDSSGGRWEWGARAERQLRSAGDFGYAYGRDPGAPPLFAGEGELLWDHWTAGLIARQPRDAGWAWRLEAGRARDEALPPEPVDEQGEPPATVPLPFGTVSEGSYWMGRATLERNPGVFGFGAVTGTALRLHAEAGTGELDWIRLEAGGSTRRVRGDLAVDARLDAGITLSDAPPVQRLFELGRYSGLPGYEVRAFGGDRVVLAQGALSYTLPLLRRPVGGGGFWLPAIAPAPTVGLRAGWTGASREAEALLGELGTVTTDGIRTTLELRLRLFGGGVSLGAARPLEQGGRWRFVWSLGQEL